MFMSELYICFNHPDRSMKLHVVIGIFKKALDFEL